MEQTKTIDLFKQKIGVYLREYAARDEQFAAEMGKPGKSLDGCADYIIGAVRETGRCGFADEEIYSMAVHYYDEDDLGEIRPAGNCRVVINDRIELTDAEKADARKRALEKYERECLDGMKQQQSRPARPASDAEKGKFVQLNIFDQ